MRSSPPRPRLGRSSVSVSAAPNCPNCPNCHDFSTALDRPKAALTAQPVSGLQSLLLSPVSEWRSPAAWRRVEAVREFFRRLPRGRLLADGRTVRPRVRVVVVVGVSVISRANNMPGKLSRGKNTGHDLDPGTAWDCLPAWACSCRWMGWDGMGGDGCWHDHASGAAACGYSRC